jgi:hypothetical protein
VAPPGLYFSSTQRLERVIATLEVEAVLSCRTIAHFLVFIFRSARWWLVIPSLIRCNEVIGPVDPLGFSKGTLHHPFLSMAWTKASELDSQGHLTGAIPDILGRLRWLVFHRSTADIGR